MVVRDNVVREMSKNTNQTKKSMEDLYDILFGISGAISGFLQEHHDVKLGALGTFKVRDTKARVGRNPSTGAAVNIPAGRKVVFQPSKTLKDLLAK